VLETHAVRSMETSGAAPVLSVFTQEPDEIQCLPVFDDCVGVEDD
jgi:hypothetical protein